MMKRLLAGLALLALPALGFYSPARVITLIVTPSQTNGGEVPSYTSHHVEVTHECKLGDHMAVEIQCGELQSSGVQRRRSPRTAGTVTDAVPPICVTEYSFTNVCQRLQAGAVNDIVRVYDRDRNTRAKRVMVTADPSSSNLTLAYLAPSPISGPIPFDPMITAMVVGSSPTYVWVADCDDDPGTGGAGFEATFGSTTASVSEAVCPPFAQAGTHRIRVRAKLTAGTDCGATPNDCLDAALFVTAYAPDLQIGNFTPSVTSGTAPLNDVEFNVALNTQSTTGDYDGNWGFSLSCSDVYEADCGVGDTDCDTADGCCHVIDIAGASAIYNTTSTAFDCDYANAGVYNPKAVVFLAGAPTRERSAAITVGTPLTFQIDPVMATTTGDTGDTWTAANPVCSGTATGAISNVVLRWETEGTWEALALDNSCQWTPSAPTHVYSTSGPKTISMAATRSNVTDWGMTSVNVSPETTLGAVLSMSPSSGTGPTAITPVIDFTGSTCTPRTISGSTCGAFCVGNFDIASTALDVYTATNGCFCYEGTSTPQATISCAGATPATVTGPSISISAASTFGISPIPSATIATAGVTGITLPTPGGVSCSGSATGAVTAATITMEKGVDAPIAATINTSCGLTSSHGKTYTTAGPKTIEVCATRAGLSSCGQATVSVSAVQTLGVTLTPSPSSGVNGVLNDVDMLVQFSGTCPGPWTISGTSCGTFGTGSFNGVIIDTVPPLEYTFADVCDYTTGASTPSIANVSCGTATPVTNVLGSSVVVDPIPTGDSFTLNVTSVPASGPASAECDASGCYLRSDIATTCGGTAAGYIREGSITWLPPIPTLPVGQGWYAVPVTFDSSCNAEIAWSTTGRRYPIGTWDYEVCTTRQIAGAGYDPAATALSSCARGSVTATDPGQTGPVFTLTGTATGTVQRGTAAYANEVGYTQWITLTNTGSASGSYTCTHNQGTLPNRTTGFETLTGSPLIGSLAPGAQATFRWFLDHRGTDQVAGTAPTYGDDTAVGTHTARLTCANDVNGANAPFNDATFTVSATSYADLEATANVLDFTVTEGVTPSSQSIYLYSIGGLPADFTITNPAQSPSTFVNCSVASTGSTTSGTAPVDPGRLEYRCTPASGMTRTTHPGPYPLSTTKTFTRTP
jgi:hypothetical protein